MKLYKGDCLEILKTIEDNSIDVSFTSPPYNSKRHKKYERDTDDKKQYYEFLCDFTNELLRVTKKYVIINIQTNYYNKKDVYKFIGRYCEEIQRIIIWEKTNPTPSRPNYLTNSYEFFIIMSQENMIKINSNYMKDVIEYPINNNHIKGHGAIMNKDVCHKILTELSNENDLVLDCFMGSGTTGVVCKEINRKFIGIEIDDKYFEIAKERINSIVEYEQMSLF